MAISRFSLYFANKVNQYRVSEINLILGNELFEMAILKFAFVKAQLLPLTLMGGFLLLRHARITTVDHKKRMTMVTKTVFLFQFNSQFDF